MSLIKQAQLDAFKKSGKIEAILSAINNAGEVTESFVAVGSKLHTLASSLVADVYMLNEYDEAWDVGAMEALLEEVSSKLEIFEDLKLTVKVDDLANVLKVKKEKVKGKKEDLTKAMGL